jgi:hypothetical protein
MAPLCGQCAYSLHAAYDYDEYQALEETAEILSDAATLEALQVGLDELARGETIELSDLRRELAEKRAAR